MLGVTHPSGNPKAFDRLSHKLAVCGLHLISPTVLQVPLVYELQGCQAEEGVIEH
jgi:hypothetical protein